MAIGVTAFKVLCAAGLLVCDCDVGDAVAGDWCSGALDLEFNAVLLCYVGVDVQVV